jgi:hypothetical protein
LNQQEIKPPILMKYVVLILFFIFSFNLIPQNKDVLDSFIVKMNSKVYLEYISSDSTAGKFRIVESINDSTRTIRLKLDTKPAMGSVLEINNPFDDDFIYKAFLYNFKKKKYIEATVFPVKEKMVAREMWPYPIEYILIKKFQFKEEK